MDQTVKRSKQLESIKNGVECAMDFDCLEQGAENRCSVRRVGRLLECRREDARNCRYAVPFGRSHFCKCPLNNYVHRLQGGPTVY